MNHISNPNTQWAELFVDELARCGLRAVSIAPGSRSTPLALAFDQHPQIAAYLHLDERSAGFFALGMALATDQPVALLCTSGTATAEFHAAIIEARQSQVPLLVLTADRPPELRHSGANQTIDQVKMYGDHVLWAVDVALPEPHAPALALRNLRTLAGRAYATANGLVKGPVHLNFPFRKPLEPERLDSGASPAPPAQRQSPFTHFARGVLAPTEDQVASLATIINRHERGLIVCGPRCAGDPFPELAATLARVSGYPLLADPLSGLRFGPHVTNAPIVGGYDTFLRGAGPGWEPPEVVIRFGAVPTSAPLSEYLSRVAPAQHIHIRADGVWADDTHQVNHFLQADPVLVCRQLAGAVAPRTEAAWLSAVLATEATCWRALEPLLDAEFFDGAAVAAVVEALPSGARLFVGNSLPVRHLDQFGRPAPRSLGIFANRGASGIDGTTSTALGIAATSRAPLVLITGDIAFYHDLNGLLAVRQHDLSNTTIVLLNNDGGHIFRHLPVARLDPPFTRLFITPHGLDFEPAVRMYGIAYTRADGRHALREALAHSVAAPVPHVVEVRTDGLRDYEYQQTIVQRVTQAIRSTQ